MFKQVKCFIVVVRQNIKTATCYLFFLLIFFLISLCLLLESIENKDVLALPGLYSQVGRCGTPAPGFPGLWAQEQHQLGSGQKDNRPHLSTVRSAVNSAHGYFYERLSIYQSGLKHMIRSDPMSGLKSCAQVRVSKMEQNNFKKNVKIHVCWSKVALLPLLSLFSRQRFSGLLYHQFQSFQKRFLV